MLVTATVDSLLDEYQRRYTERDAEGVTNLCVWPFVAIRKGEAIHLLTVTLCAITSLRRFRPIASQGVVTWRRVETDGSPPR